MTKNLYKLIILIALFSIQFDNVVFGQILLNVKIQNDLIKNTYLDTIISIDDLEKSITVFESLETFNHIDLKKKSINENTISFFNDTINVLVKSAKFDVNKFQLNLKSDKHYYLKNSFYGVDEKELTLKTTYLPDKELESIQLNIKGHKFDLPEKELANYFNPSLNLTKCFILDNGSVLLYMENSVGAGFYRLLFLFDKEGKLIKKLVRRII